MVPDTAPETSSATPEAPELTARERAIELAKHGEAVDLLDVWDEIVANPPTDAEFYNQVIRGRATTYDPQAIHDLMARVVEEAVKREDWQTVLRVADSCAGTWPDSDPIRDGAVKALYARYESHPNIEDMIPMTRLEDGAMLDQGLKRFRAILKLSPGRTYQHAEWGVGIVKELDLRSGKVVIDFPTEQNRTLTIAGVRDFLTYLPPTSLLSIRATEPEKLTAMAEEDPAGLVRLALSSNRGKIKQSELKNMLLAGVLPEKKWTGWWNRARSALKLDPMIDFAKGGAHSEISLRSRPKTFEEEVQDLYFAPDSNINDKVNAVRLLQDNAQRHAPSKELIERMIKALELDYPKLESPADRLQASFLATDLATLGGLPETSVTLPNADQQLEAFTDSYDELSEIESTDYASRALRSLMQRDGERGYELAAGLFPLAPSRLAQLIWKALDPEQHKDISIHAVQNLFERPLENPTTFLWALKQIADGNWGHLGSYFSASQVVPDMLDNLDSWEKLVDRPSVDKPTQATAKLLVSRVKSIIEAHGYGFLCAAVEKMELDQVRKLRRNILGHQALSDTWRSGADRQIVLTRRELMDETSSGAAGAAIASTDGEGVHYCTARARVEKLAELEDLTSNKIPANSREIEKARSEGDLKENAGYIYAKEQQKLLMQASLGLQQALQTARVFDSSKVSTATINFGTNFVAQNLTKDTTETYTVLGRFETDPDKNIISYQAPFMQQFIGLAVGDTVTVTHPSGGSSDYKIVSIGDALEGGDWDVSEEDN